jgi:hypothetical protein
MTLRQVSAFFLSWKGIFLGVTGILTFVGWDAKVLAQKMETFIETQAVRDALQDEKLETLDGLALSACLQETHPVARMVLECGRREALAGVIRK